MKLIVVACVIVLLIDRFWLGVLAWWRSDPEPLSTSFEAFWGSHES